MQHSNAKLTPAGRRRLVALVIDEGLSLGLAARRCGVSKSTAWEWTARWRAASPSERESGACLHDRSSRPHRSPNRTRLVVERRVVLARQLTGWGPRLIAGRVGVPHSTVHRVLARHGISRPERPDRREVVRYEWPCPGDLLHMDTKRYARFTQPGHAVTGDRTRKSRGAGYTYAHVIVDDHSRLAYVELHPDERAQTVTGFVARALAWFTNHGVVCKRLMTDNAFAYTKNISLAGLLADREIRHLTTRPYRPQTNGKVERFHQTMAREWGYGMTYASDRHRDRALPYWTSYYNEQRPHSALGGQSPISRVRNLPGHDS
jgi:transposase InsO family protein